MTDYCLAVTREVFGQWSTTGPGVGAVLASFFRLCAKHFVLGREYVLSKLAAALDKRLEREGKGEEGEEVEKSFYKLQSCNHMIAEI